MAAGSIKAKDSLAVRLGLAVLSSILFRLSFPTPSLIPLAWIALAPLFWVCVRATPRRAAVAAGLSGLLVALLSLPGFRHLTWAAYLAPACVGAVYYAVVGAGISWASNRDGIPLIITAPTFWTAYEFLRSVIPVIKFPWLLAGQTQVSWTTLIQAADLGGVYLLSFLVILFNAYLASVALAWREPRRREKTIVLGWIPLGLVLVTLLYGVIRIRTIEVETGPKVALIQGNVPQAIKLDDQGQKMLQEYMNLTRRAIPEDPDLIVWPETMYPYPIDPAEMTEFSDPERKAYLGVRESLLRTARGRDISFLIGAIRAVGDDMRNSAYLFSPDGTILGRYDKIDLVPLGETIPFHKAWPALGKFISKNFLPEGFGSLEPGERVEIFELGRHKFAVSICYEISFPNLAREARAGGADFIVSISNDAWFEDGAELDLAKDQAIFRAVENRIGIARAANTGISSFVDPIGRSRIFTDRGKRKQVAGVLARRITTSSSTTVYTKIGDLFAWLMVAGSALILLPIGRLRKTRPEDEGKPA
ncbi:MAG: apolipoprotein N-acyltransferase [Planctomycetota bacterium]|nr:apolipoprotein N-acyltransferase [Planctomycetota bacterium]